MSFPRRFATVVLFAACLAASLVGTRAIAEPGMPFTEPGISVVRDGVFLGKVYVGRKAAPEEREAAERIAHWIGRVTGTKAEVAVENPGKRERGIYVGATRNAEKSCIRAPETISHEAFVFDGDGRRAVFLVGESPLATRLSAGRFIRDVLGVEFLAPGEFGADWAPLRDLSINSGRREFRPGIAWRRLSGLNTEAERTWAADMGLGSTPPMDHALHKVFDAKAHAENPAMFPLLGGTRVAPSGRGGYEPQPNLANPDSAVYAAKRAAGFFKANPEAPAFSLCINDNMTWDESPESKAALGEDRYFRNRPDYSDYVFGFMNRTARALRATASTGDRAGESPRFLTAYAYYHCENAPSFRVEPEVFPVLTADRSEWRDAGFAAEDRALIDRWSNSGAARFGIYDYYYGRDVAAPRIFFKAQAESLAYAAERGAALFYAEIYPDWGVDGPKAWLAARLAWDASVDASALLDSYYTRAYGPAAPHMRRFYEIAESRWAGRTQPPHWIRFFREESVAELFPMETCVAMREALRAAERAFSESTRDRRTELRQMRVRATSLSFAKTEAFVAAYAAKRRLEAAPVATDRAGLEKLFALFDDAEKKSACYRDAVRRTNESPMNPGSAFSPDVIWSFDAFGAAVAKSAGAWREIRPEDGRNSWRVAAACLAESPADGVETVVNESFARDSFRAASSGSWAARKGLTIPRAPWRCNLFEGESTRFGFFPEKAASDRGALLVAGGDLAKLSRGFGVFGDDVVAVKLRHSGHITPGVHVGLSIRFMDSQGRDLPGGAASVALPGGGAEWRTLAVTAVAPSGADRAEITLRIMNQEASDALRVDDFLVRRCALGEPLE